MSAVSQASAAIREGLIETARDLLDGTEWASGEYVRGMVELIVQSSLLTGEDADFVRAIVEARMLAGLPLTIEGAS